eukprot:Transcript_21500.p1 GENE.Transcript_21500~~Transcript_21500.p1  ORF type:complete len:284 (+),score=27.11 Transcript_21500:380-1231(+)
MPSTTAGSTAFAATTCQTTCDFARNGSRWLRSTACTRMGCPATPSHGRVCLSTNTTAQSQWDKPVYDVSSESWPHWAGSIISRSVPGLYNTDCGVIVAPQAVQVLCSYYADFTSWNEGCGMDDIVGSVHGHAMSRPPSRPRNRPYDGPDQLKEMLEMSLELQNGCAAMPREEWGTRGERRTRARRRRLRAEGNGEPERWDVWDGYYNEVLINRSWYAARLPRAVAGIFYLSGGWEEEDSRQCAQRTLDRMRAQYGDAAADVSVFALTPGEGFSLPADLEVDRV